MGNQPKIDEILEKFVTALVIIFECYFVEYHERLYKRIPKKGKTADAIDGVAELIKGTFEIFEGPIKAGAIVIYEVIRTTTGMIGNKCNRDDLKKLSCKLRDFKKNPDDLKNILIESGEEICRSFESQFAKLTANDNSWETAVEKVAEDAVIRIIYYLKNNPEKDFSVRTMLEGVLFGMSKRYKSPNSKFVNLRKGHSVRVGDFKIKTTDFFKKIGLSNGNEYYRYRSNKSWPLSPSDWRRCGFRLVFNWEDVSSYTKYIKLNEAPPDKYTYVLTPDVFERVRNDIMKKVRDEQVTEHLENILTDMKTEATRASVKIIGLLEKNADIVSQISQEFKKIQESLEIIHEITSESNTIVKGNQEILLDIREKVVDLHKGVNNILPDCILFDIMDPSDLFTGRIKDRKRIDKSLQRLSEQKSVFYRMACVSGLGGIGKSELARQYIKDCRVKSDNVSATYSDFIWINAENENSLSNSFLRLAEEKLHIEMRNAMGNPKDIKVIVKNVYEKLGGRNKCLFILDNAENQGYLPPFLPLQVIDGSLPYFLLTSRDKEWDKRIEVLPLEEMDMAEAVEFVEKGLGTENGCEHKNVKLLVETVQYFPLAIQQAVSYILAQREVNDVYYIANYLKEFNGRTQKLLCSEAFKTLFMDNTYSKTTFTTWDLTFEKIDSDKDYGKLASFILNIMAYLSPDDIHREMFFKLPEYGEDEVKEAVRLLVKYSMTKGEHNQRVLKIHRLVQQVTRIRLDLEMKSDIVIETVNKLLMSCYPLGSNTSELNVERRKLLPHFEAFIVHLNQWIVKRPEDEEKIERTFLLVELLRHTANFSFNLGKSRRAKQAFVDIMAILKKRNSKVDQIAAAMISVECFPILSDLGEYKEMLETIDEALLILEQYYKGDSRYAVALEKRAAALVNLGRYEEAEEAYNKVLSIHESCGDTLNVAITKINLSNIYGLKGDAHKKKTLLEEVLPIIENNYERDHTLLAHARFQLASAHMSLNNVDTEIELLEKCKVVYEKTQGEGHVMGRIWLLLGDAYGKKGDREKNIEYSERALSILKNHYSDEHHIEVARCMSHLADAIGDSGDTQEKLRILKCALTGFEKFHDGGSWETGYLLVEIAHTHDKLGQTEEAKQAIQKAISMMESHPRSFREEQDRLYITKLKGILS